MKTTIRMLLSTAAVSLWLSGCGPAAAPVAAAQECPIAGELRNEQGVCGNVFAGFTGVPESPTEACPYGYMPNAAGDDCVVAPGFTVSQPQPRDTGVEDAIRAQTQVLRQMQADQASANIRTMESDPRR